MSFLFFGMACLLMSAAAFWVFGRGAPRPPGTWAMGALLTSFAVAFASYAPLFEDTVESLVPHSARLLSNSASLAAAASILAVSFQLNLDPVEAKRRVRLRLVLLGGAVLTMTLLFSIEQATHRSPQVYALYLLVFLSYLGFAVIDFLRQALRQSRSTRRSSVRVGLRLASAGCVFALLYTGYKATRMVALGLGLRLFPDQAECSTLFSSPCVFSVTAPAVAVLLICLGLTLPAVIYPINLARRRRWEKRSLATLEPLWSDLTAALPSIVLPSAGLHEDGADDSDFVLQRRVVEISDGILALRPYRSRDVQEGTSKTVDVAAEYGAALVEAAVVRDALKRLRSDSLPGQTVDLPASGASARGGDLRAETEWLLAIADAYTHDSISRVGHLGQAERVGT